jgi:uncharacterized protein YqhQ
MRSSKLWTVAVRGPDKGIVVKKEGLLELPKPLKMPLLRGVVALFQALSIGIRALLFSAEASGQETEKPSTFSLSLTVIAAFAIGIALFLLLPLYCTKLLGIVLQSVNESSLIFNLVDGIVRVMVFLIYIMSINISKEIRRVFQYHGAEHKAVNAFEAGSELTPESVKNYSTLHPRCGTSFLLIVMIMSILIFSLIPNEWLFIDKFFSRIILIPLIAGLSYEFVKFSSRKMNNPLVRLISMPGLWLQRLTTGVPSRDQLEVAIKALNEVLHTESLNPGTGEDKSNVTG